MLSPQKQKSKSAKLCFWCAAFAHGSKILNLKAEGVNITGCVTKLLPAAKLTNVGCQLTTGKVGTPWKKKLDRPHPQLLLLLPKAMNPKINITDKSAITEFFAAIKITLYRYRRGTFLAYASALGEFQAGPSPEAAAVLALHRIKMHTTPQAEENPHIRQALKYLWRPLLHRLNTELFRCRLYCPYNLPEDM